MSYLEYSWFLVRLSARLKLLKLGKELNPWFCNFANGGGIKHKLGEMRGYTSIVRKNRVSGSGSVFGFSLLISP